MILVITLTAIFSIAAYLIVAAIFTLALLHLAFTETTFFFSYLPIKLYKYLGIMNYPNKRSCNDTNVKRPVHSLENAEKALTYLHL